MQVGEEVEGVVERGEGGGEAGGGFDGAVKRGGVRITRD